MDKYYIGIDIGSISTKAVMINQDRKIIASEYLWTEGNPIEATKKVITKLKEKMPIKNPKIYGVGTTGSARNLVGSVVGANIIKNEITAHAIGTLSIYPDVRTILEIGGQDSKIIILNQGIVVDYAMNTLCAAGTGAFLSSQSKRLGIDISDMGDIALSSKNPSKIAARCTVFAESDLVHKAQIGHKKEDLVAGLCNSVVKNYLNNLSRGKKIKDRVVFQGGVSKNKGVIKAFENELDTQIFVDENSHLMGALGIAILSQKANKEEKELAFDFNIQDIDFKTLGVECKGCSNNCEIVYIYKNGNVIDKMGGRCEKFNLVEAKSS
ncbi:MAG: acyl-CoA dehydratase activase [Clostridia bacterium]|nr:acyl-CoA dehydratase activase [Clostridia bacterium]